jgi:hypothetical protein
MSDESIADITPLPVALRGRVLTSSAKLVENGIFLGQFLLFVIVAFAPAVLGGLAATKHLFPGNNALSFAPVLIGLGITAGLCWVLGGQMLRKPWSADYMFRKAQTELLRRKDAIVNPKMSEAIFVEVVPRRNWGQLALQNAEDVGFLHIDSQGRQLLIEGDHKRYKIPVEAIVSYDMELMNPKEADDERGTPVGLVVLKLRDQLGERELPLRPVRSVSGDPLGGNYVERAQELRERILEMCPARREEPAEASAGV